MSTEAELLAAIDASPDDDAPRLAHAAWLQENGDPARAELIRLQVGKEEQNGIVSEREKELLAQHGARWLAGRPVVAGMEWTFERGYPEVVWFRTIKAFRATWQEVFVHPVRRAVFSDLRGDP